mmetsp:Transcript_18081/g.37529  ORF Transcript_18081/g.37529 Transcript_18081/m.37529 type:complete len:413 (-) Transcript_18081:1796-3034(-)
MDAFLDWMRAGGASWSVAVGASTVTNADRGLLRLAGPGTDPELLLSVPPTLILSRETILQSPIGSILHDIVEILAESEREGGLFVLFLMYERQNRASFWRPFLDVLPCKFTTPLYFSDQELELLQGSPLYPLVNQVKQELEETFQHLVVDGACHAIPDIFNQGIASFENFLWAFSVLNSRAFQTKFMAGLGKDQPGTALIVPLADMTNHRPISNAMMRGADTDDSNFELVPKPNVQTMEREWFISYGHLPNWTLLLHYGFVIENNIHDTVEITLDEPDDEDNDCALRKFLFFELFPQYVGLDHSLCVNDERSAPRKLLQSVRLLMAGPDELRPLDRYNFADKIRSPLSERSEAAARTTIRSILEGLLENLSRESVKHLEDYPRPGNVRSIEVYKNGQQRILRHTLVKIDELI